MVESLTSTQVIVIVVAILVLLWFVFGRKSSSPSAANAIVSQAKNKRSMEEVDKQFASLMQQFKAGDAATR